MRIFIALSLLMVSGAAVASEKLVCEYAVGALSTPPNLLTKGNANVIFDGKSFTAYRLDGSFVVTPPLTEKKDGMIFVDDKTKVFAASLDRSNFAVSDRIKKTTEQWAKCSGGSSYSNERDQISGSPVSTSEIEKIKRLPGIAELHCSNFIDKRYSQSKNIFYKIKPSIFAKMPLVSGGDITCEVSSNIWNWNETNVMAVEHGLIDRIPYTLYHSDGSGNVGVADQAWSFGCVKDSMTDKKQCEITNESIRIIKKAKGYSAIVGNEHFPGRSAYIRVGQGKPIASGDNGYFPNVTGIVGSINGGTKLLTRYTKWPYDYVVDTEVNTIGFEQANFLLGKTLSVY
ncbi:TPA: hypothetical protein UOJ16_000788 [Klebsiella pneumoniae]|uniref:Uncharacterized protein n=1 Tax=Klebsiella pneumoniae TaxID=573 RepID=A0A486MIL2_KLEPN|nr:hypothetical protein [Klebsiella pneumoniae]MBK1917370.1 hypothetical protein [Klebsiella pneumoniae subsp. pneumoniae]EKU6111523.1 hypothetical protein [Klebsiella pneumoniae]EKV8546271.1 hypothetical protein [Klebsiella pneumoniae]EKZ9795005.1 hypothetical protein [Klebsiella pneumoniae]EMB5593449.1 hypothetical protein [Klebsiella pneumoniae]